MRLGSIPHAIRNAASTNTDAKKSWGEPLNRWGRHFKQAKEPHVSETRKEIRRHLTEGKRQAEMFAST